MKVEVFRTKKKKIWCYRIKEDGEVIITGEGYKSKQKAKKVAKQLVKDIKNGYLVT